MRRTVRCRLPFSLDHDHLNPSNNLAQSHSTPISKSGVYMWEVPIKIKSNPCKNQKSKACAKLPPPPPPITEGGLRTIGKSERATMRKRESYRKGTAVNWNRKALSAYTWMRTEKGPQRQWLHRIGKADSPYCSCDASVIQSGAHITFACPHHAQARRRLIANQQSWKELDSPHWIRTGPNEYEDGVISFFEYLFHQLT